MAPQTVSHEDALAAHEAEVAALRAQELAAIRILKIRAARESLLDFIELLMEDPEFPGDASHTTYVAKPHHKLMIGAVERVERRELMRSAYSLPPQHGKTTILSLYGMAWILGKHPRWNIIVGTYSEARAQKVGSELRDILQSDAFSQVFPKCQMKRGSKAKDDMEFVLGGSIILRGRGSGTTGQPCDLFVIDDPIKDHIEGASAAALQECKDWYSSVAFSRVRTTTPIMIVHTRWNEDDLIGWLCDPEHPENIAKPERTARWKYLNIPAIVDDPELAEILGVEVGSALWEEEFPLSLLAEANDNDPRIFSALYLGRPSPADGDFFKATHIVGYRPDQRPKNLRIYAASDHAVGLKQRNDETCLLIVGLDEDGVLWLLDAAWGRFDSKQAVDEMLRLMKLWRPLFWWAESGHISKSIGPFLRTRMREENTYINVVEQVPVADKVTRAQGIQARGSQGMIRWPLSAPWYERARSQTLKFPNGKHDDFVDALAHIGLGLGLQNRPSKPKTKTIAEQAPVGSLNWIKQAANDERAEKRRTAGTRDR
jgi:predicted phage terminase large subunit-like protein